MKVVVQRVKEASCEVNGTIVSSIKNGFLLLVGFTHTDTLKEVKYCAKKVSNLRIFEDENGKLNIGIKALNYDILSISQFTLYADTHKGNRPSFVDAMAPTQANTLYEAFNQTLEHLGLHVEKGVFQHHMNIHLINDGPVTIIIEKDANRWLNNYSKQI